jgi:hypothetical protein
MNEAAGNCNAEVRSAALPRPNGDNTPARLAGSKETDYSQDASATGFFSRERLELPNNPELKAAISGPWSVMLAAPVPRTGKATGIIWLSDHLMLGA